MVRFYEVVPGKKCNGLTLGDVQGDRGGLIDYDLAHHREFAEQSTNEYSLDFMNGFSVFFIQI